MNANKTGIIRKIDDLGRIVLPAELRRFLGLDVQDAVEIHAESNQIIIRKHSSSCSFCGSSQELFSFHGKLICQDCLTALSALSPAHTSHALPAHHECDVPACCVPEPFAPADRASR